MQALLGYTSQSRWVRYARAPLGHLFRYLPGQPGYNRRLRAAAAGLATRERDQQLAATLGHEMDCKFDGW